ncbi:MAG TPA: acetamidase/formamidase family protein [Pseudoneobacillus sp.]|nr:acetamidase/formamidase family protein [Pseudoneobacillus sp.]
MSKKHVLELKNEHLQASFSKDYEPILTIRSGDSIQFSTPDIGWGYSPKEGSRIRYSSREQEGEWGHPVIGPIFIEGAKPGMVLEVKINDIVPGWYGWNCAAGKSSWTNDQLEISHLPEVTLDWELDAQKNNGKCTYGNKSFSVELRPFLGLMATAPSEEGVHSTIPPYYFGGNIDCKELVRGSSLFLPVTVEGALFVAGDGHAAQGDGEVSGQAIECPMDFVDLTLVLHEEKTLIMPVANTPSGWITFGFDEDLNKATSVALEGMVNLIQELYDVEKAEATALASIVVDLKITQIVNQIKGVHAVLPHGALR